jgi:ferredoxin-NADP reductase
MQTYRTVLVNKIPFPNGVDLLRFSLQTPSSIVFFPGQYIILKVPSGVSFVNRLYSIASSSTQTGSFELLIKRIPGGLASNYINSFAVGQSVEFSGPAGQFSLKNTPQTKVFLTTGTGIAPVRSFILSNRGHIQKHILFWGMPSVADLYLFDELKSVAIDDPLFTFFICLSKETSLDKIDPAGRSYFRPGHINDAVKELVGSPSHNGLEFYICGRREVVESLREFLYSHNIDRSLIFFERY